MATTLRFHSTCIIITSRIEDYPRAEVWDSWGAASIDLHKMFISTYIIERKGEHEGISYNMISTYSIHDCIHSLAIARSNSSFAICSAACVRVKTS